MKLNVKLMMGAVLAAATLMTSLDAAARPVRTSPAIAVVAAALGVTVGDPTAQQNLITDIATDPALSVR